MALSLYQQICRLPIELQHWIQGFFSLDILVNLAHVPGFTPLAHSILHIRVENLLRKFGLPASTLDVMRRHDIVISGSAALAIINPGSWLPGDVDFYCPYEEVECALGWFRVHGYAQEPSPAPTNLAAPADKAAAEDIQYFCNHGIFQVYFLKNTISGRKIQLVQSRSRCPLLPVFFFHSTPVMNYVTGTGVSCCYPSLTLNNKGLRNCDPDSSIPCLPPNTFLALNKYAARGYLIEDRLDDGDPTSSSKWEARQCDDGENLQMPFSPGATVYLGPRFKWTLAVRWVDRRYGRLYGDPSVSVVTEEGVVHYAGCPGYHSLGEQN